MTMTSNGVPISHLGDPPTHQNHGLYVGCDSWLILVGNKSVTGVLHMLGRWRLLAS